MGKLLKGCFFGGCIVYIWMMISWMVLPWHCLGFNSFQNERAVSSVILENIREDGTYVLPNFCHAKNDSNFDKESMAKSPIIFASIQRKGFESVSIMHYVTSFIIQLVGAFLITTLLLFAKVPFYWKRVFFVTVIGLLVGILGVLPNWNWWGFSFNFVAIQILDFVIAWFLAGLVIAAFTRPWNHHS